MFEVPVLLVLIVVVALIFDFTNGAHDCANAIATVVSTKVLSPRVAVVMAASLNWSGAFLGTKVATTLGAGIVNTDMVANCQPLVLAALLGAIAWNLITWYFGIPSSSSHALIGGLMGAAVAYAGFSTLNGASIAEKILLPLILSPLAGFGMGFLTMFLIMLLCARANRNKLTRAFTKLQIVSAAFMATSHGLNDAQKTMGVITLVVSLIAAVTAGPITDRLGRRKLPVALASCLFAVGAAMPLFFRSPMGMYLFAAVAGLGYGVYNAIDQALNVAVLPNPKEAGKDLGILNLANTLSTVIGTAMTSLCLLYTSPSPRDA